MEWVFRSPQLHSTFSNLGFLHAGGYHVNEHCNAALETILHNILTEDKYLCTYRRSINFGQNVKKDLIPLLINAKEDKTIELLIKILVYLTIPTECLLSMDAVSKTGVGRHTIFEINNLLATTKLALTDHRATKVIIEFLKKNSNLKRNAKMSPEQCVNISNTLLFLRNILHIPEGMNYPSLTYNGSPRTVQNQLLWNLFSQNIDTVLIKLMCMPDTKNWVVTMVQLLALLYKDQHVTTLHKLLNLWLDASICESSEDNESNTSPQHRDRNDSSPNLTSDPISDSSDTGGSGKSNDDPGSINNDWDASSRNNMNDKQQFELPRSAEGHAVRSVTSYNNKTGDNSKDITMKSDTPVFMSGSNENDSENDQQTKGISENSDYGYGTQIENQESISTSSNEDELPTKKPVHQKPHSTKQRINNKVRSNFTLQERKRNKIVKRGKINITTIREHNTLTDDDISNVLKEFTINFLLKGYNSLVKKLHGEILTNIQLEIDTSHFFWLFTYFLKFATQIELDLEHVSSILSLDIISYLTAEGVNLCEQFELTIKLNGNELKPTVRRLHLVVTAIREFVQAIEMYKKFPHTCDEDQEKLVMMQMKMCETQELRSLLVLLLRHYNPKYQSKQYLQDLIVTNHILLMFLDNTMKMPEYKGSVSMPDHIKQFATPEIMSQYGLLLENYKGNGEFVNDCIFTMMHHVSGELGCVATLFQPTILKTFTSIWNTEYATCDDWSDLIEYVINTFTKKPELLQCTGNFRLESTNFDLAQSREGATDAGVKRKSTASSETSSNERWTEDEISSLSWNYMECNKMSDVIGEIVKIFKEDGLIKTRNSVIKELFKESIIHKEEFEKLLKSEMDRNSKTVQITKEMRDDEIGKLCEKLALDGKSTFLDWVKTVVLDICYAKIYLEEKAQSDTDSNKKDHKILNYVDAPVASPVTFHSLALNQSVPLVPWNCEQASICKDLIFLQLLHKLGFHMPVDSGKVFIRIPHFWTPDFIFDVASKISPIDKTKLKFSLSEVMKISLLKSNQRHVSTARSKDAIKTTPLDNLYQENKQNSLGTAVNFTPMPGSSFNLNDDEGKEEPNWLEIIQDCQEFKISSDLGRPGSSFNLNEDEGHKPNWLEVIQNSQEYKISSDSGSSLLKEKIEVKVTEMEGSVKQVEDACMPEAAREEPAATASACTSAKPEINYNLEHMESEYYNNSVCETASVASDLTRMYVSDEDEKAELPIRPIVEVKPLSDKLPSNDTDSVAATAEKRPRVHFFPTF